MSLYWKVSTTLWLSSKNSAAAYRGPGEFYIPELHNLLVWILFLKTQHKTDPYDYPPLCAAVFQEYYSIAASESEINPDAPSFCPRAHTHTP